MNTTTNQTQQERQADTVTIIFLSIALLSLLSIFFFVFPNVKRSQYIDAYIRTSQEADRKADVQARDARRQVEIAEYNK